MPTVKSPKSIVFKHQDSVTGFFFLSHFFPQKKYTEIICTPYPCGEEKESFKTHTHTHTHTRQQQPANKLFDQSQLTLTPSKARNGNINCAGVFHGCGFSSRLRLLPQRPRRADGRVAGPEGSAVGDCPPDTLCSFPGDSSDGAVWGWWWGTGASQVTQW